MSEKLSPYYSKIYHVRRKTIVYGLYKIPDSIQVVLVRKEFDPNGKLIKETGSDVTKLLERFKKRSASTLSLDNSGLLSKDL